ncbi:MAG TPA: SpoIIE family protein phosphatase [Candidatus Acidoferrales bacterium]|nr:SpoIIE family protein phosphatase [Candidatus Acidoferrales bacterium]
MEQKVRSSPVESGVAISTLHGQKEPGDSHVIVEAAPRILFAVIDGLGHGEEAAEAAEIAASVIREFRHESVIPLVQRCHELLRGTRGVVMSLGSINSQENTVTWLGVGNVEGLLLHRDSYGTLIRETMTLRGGVVGDRLPNLFAGVFPLSPGDTIVLVTDGIRGDFADDLPLRESVQGIADYILARFSRGTDDALALVIRYWGPEKEAARVEAAR